MSTCPLVTAVVVVCGAPILLAQQSPPERTPVFQARVEAVTVDVKVLDRQGQPVRGLALPDFTVTVDGQPRRVVSADFIDVAASRAAAAQPSGQLVSTNEGAGVGRLVLFVVDENTIEPGQLRHVTRAASRLLEGLSYVDRSALVVLPVGPDLEFTWAHDRVRAALERAMGRSMIGDTMDYGSLAQARDLAGGNPSALREAAFRECGTTADNFGGSGVGGGADPGGATTASPSPGDSGGSSAPGSPPGGSTSGGGAGAPGAQGGGGSSRGGGSRGLNPFGNSCTRDLQMRAEWTWRNALTTSLSSIGQLRHALAGLARIPGDKTVVLISGGWPLDDRDEHSLIAQVAADASAARATIYSLFIPPPRNSVSARLINSTPLEDTWLQLHPLDNLSAMTGGTSFQVQVGAETAFDKIRGELGAYYRLGIEKDATDTDAKRRSLKVQVSRSGATVRARDVFDTRTFEDRDWTARLASALQAPVVATGIGLRVTSYLASDPGGANLKLVLTGEASRVEPGAASFQLLIQDSKGKRVMSEEQPAGEPVDEGLAFSANLPLAPDSYLIRIAVMDGMGRTGAVDHHVEVRPEMLGDLEATGPLLVRVPTAPGSRPRFAVRETRQDERLAMEVHLGGATSQLQDTRVTFEIAQTADGPALVQVDPDATSQKGGWLSAQAVTDLRLLTPGDYISRVRVESAGKSLGVLTRPFTVVGRNTDIDRASSSDIAHRGDSAARPLTAAIFAAAPRFSAQQALSPDVLHPFLDRVASRPDAQAPAIRQLVDRARAGTLDQVAATELTGGDPAATFLRGLALLGRNQLNEAADAFRAALRAAPDFYPAMVYLGACYAAGGKDKDAAAAWRTAMIKESDQRPLHLLLIDALLRQQQGELALQTSKTALARWPEDDELKRRFVMASLLAGQYAEGLQALEKLIDIHAEDESTLTAGLLTLYESIERGQPIQDGDSDRARMARLADAYRAIGGSSVALVDSWVEASKRKK